MTDPLKEIERAAKQGREKESTDRVIKFFQKEMEAARKREKKWRADAAKVLDIYEAKKADENTFNILYANTEVLLPVLYSGSPRPMVERAFQDDDPLAKAGAEVIERILKFLIRQRGNYTPFSSLMSKAVLGALLPGRGLTQFEYDANIQEEPSTVPPEEGDKDEIAAAETETGEEAVPVPGMVEKVGYESVCGCNWEYDKILMGYAREWADVPWVAFEYFMDREDLKVNFPDAKDRNGDKLADKIPLETPSEADELGKARKKQDEDDNLGTIKGARVYGIWWKTKRKVVFYCPQEPDYLLKEIDDPLQLSTFYNFPAPLTLFFKYRPQVPTILYKLYEQQAKELNRLSKRINRLCEALKVRGLYDGALGDELKSLLASDDNTFLPAKNTQMLSDKPNLANFIWEVPIEGVVAALKECIMAREACKTTIYEINGIADIMRAVSGPYDTASAVQQKNKWGTLRISKGQARVQNYVRDSLQIMAEIACKYFGQETFQAMTNLDYSTEQDVQQAQQTIQMLNQQMQQMMLAAQQQQPLGAQQPGGQPPQQGQQGQQPQQPQPTPQMQQQMQQAQAVLAKPQWEKVIELLRDDIHRNYRIDIETDSTLAKETQATQEEINEAMQSLAQMYQSFLPAVEGGALTMPALKQMIKTVVRNLPFGKNLEDAIDQMPDQLPQKQDPAMQVAQIKAQAEIRRAQLAIQADQREDTRAQQQHEMDMQRMQMEAQAQQAETEQKRQQAQIETSTKQQLAAMEIQKGQIQLQREQEEMALRQQNAAVEREMKQHDLAMKRAARTTAEQQAGAARTEAQVKMATAKQAIAPKKPRRIKVTRDMLGKIESLELGDADYH